MATNNTTAILADFDSLPDIAYVKRPTVQRLWGGISAFEVDRLEKAKKLGTVEIISEEEFLKLIIK